MATPRYLPTATFKTWWKTETTADDTLIEAAINAAEMAIDNALQRRMIVASGAATERVFRPTGSDVLYIDDCTEVTSIVENDVTLTSGTHFVLEPLNGLAATGEAWPYYRVARYGQCWYTDGPKATVAVTAKWGWAAIPYEVIESCKIVAADMLSNRDMRNGLVAITEAGGVGSRENRTVKEMVNKYQFFIRTVGIA
jgi:hypothetical protein